VAHTRTILIVDDDAHIREVVRFALQRAGLDVVEADCGRAALQLVEIVPVALVVLDIVMPGMDGLDVCRALRQPPQGSAAAKRPVPVVFLSSRDDELDRIIGLEIGGDDYVTKPFSPRELVARVKAVLRRTDPDSTAATTPALTSTSVVEVGGLTLDPARFEACFEGRAVPLTVTEFNLLRTFIARPGVVFTRQQILDRVYGPAVMVSDRTIDSHVRRLRRKLADAGVEPIETVHGLGYRLREPG